MNQERPDPDRLLASLQKEEARQKRGKLKIFLGMCPGVGKTYAMLQSARQRQAEGADVLVGVAETHGRKETEALLENLAIASKIKRPYRSAVLEEMDLDAILAIRPDLVVVDELAHTNAPGSRHPKRYQDVLELLAAGIDVYTTLNVQHLESRSEAVHQITGVKVQETVPDSLLDEADEITLIDLSPEQLRQRLKEGKVYLGEHAMTAADHFFREENLTALREMALRLTAERVNQDLREIMSEQRIEGPWKSGERLLVAVGPTPYSESLIRWTRRAAASLNAQWIAAYIETPKTLDEEAKKRLARNLTLARQLGAEVIVRSGTDIAETLLQVARDNNVSQICVGKPSRGSFWQWLGGASFLPRLVRMSGDIDVHLVRVKSLGSMLPKKKSEQHVSLPAQEYGMVLAIVTAVTLICFIVEKRAGYSSVSLIYLSAVVLSGKFLGRWAVLLLAFLSALLWNFLFIPPRFTFLIHQPHDFLMFAMYFIVALVIGQITSRLREREQTEKKQEERVNTLYRLTRTVAMTHDARSAIQNTLAKLEETLKAEGTIFLTDQQGRIDFDKPRGRTLLLSGKERSVATWTFQKKEPAGKFTDTLPEAEHFYLPLVSFDKTVGIIVIRPSQTHLWTLDQHNFLESFASLITAILEKDLLARMTEESKIKAESEKLQTALLDSVSHELKTPLSVIAGSAEHLEKCEPGSEAFRKLVLEIRLASQRLLQTVNGLLDMTRLDSGHLQLNLEWHDMHDVVRHVMDAFANQLRNHTLAVKYADNLPLVKIDVAVIRQVLTNLISNAITYTPENTEVTVSIQTDQSSLIVSVTDRGPGFDENETDKIFEKFVRGKSTKPGGLGLGLSIAKRFVQAHGGNIEARNQTSGGACFTFQIPVELFRSDEKLDS